MFRKNLICAALLLLLPFISCYANTDVEPTYPSLYCKNTNKKIFYFTFPKGGTHLLMKAIDAISPGQQILIMNNHYIELVSYPQLNNQFWREKVFFNHLYSFYNFLADSLDLQLTKVIGIRDPRDVIISTVHWIHSIHDMITDQTMYGPFVIEEFIKLPFEEQITAVILMPDQFESIHYTENMRIMSQNALHWMKNPSVHVVRFEDLVGPKGGGDLDKQRSAIRALAQHIERPLSDEQVNSIADSLFGETTTFRKGQIGSWKENFTPYHKELIKQTMGKELIELGYEKDDNW